MSTRVSTRAEGEERVTPLELFFDLVFVYAITQVTGLVSANPTWTGVAEGLVVLGLLWWSWTAYAWLTGTGRPGGGRHPPVDLRRDGRDADRLARGAARVRRRRLALRRRVRRRARRAPRPLRGRRPRRPRAARRDHAARVRDDHGGGAARASAPRSAATRRSSIWAVAIVVDLLGALHRRRPRLAPRRRPLRRAARADRHHRARRVDRRARRRARLGQPLDLGVVVAGAARPGRRVRAVVGVLRRRRDRRRAAAAPRRGHRGAVDRARLVQLPAPADDRRDHLLRRRREEDARARRRPAAHRAGRRAVRRRRALPARPRRLPPAEHAHVERPARRLRGDPARADPARDRRSPRWPRSRSSRRSRPG